ncbi:MAG: LysR family transcriptional regulator [Sphingomonas bacterium]|uniref:LysR family transcriptional regulator n=1 Tax=Sphingomonas bacterium TaxID=1895847 RepID=UPI0026208222|nr:LysR family transcriptional regulator [Sphingomonas bacterium]MDB5694561.1 LysR family transcriptional regulator [Sphingomonas bacterium]
MNLPDLEAWAIFAAVVEHRSFSAAAAHLGVNKATVSKAVARLEARLGQSLFHRTSRRVVLTEAGKPLADHARRILADAVAAEEAARDGAHALAGSIRVAAPLGFGIGHVAPLVARFLADHPDVAIDLHLSDARIDIVGDSIDVALRIGDLADSSLRGRRLGDVRTHIAAAPAYLVAHGTPAHPADLAQHRLLTYSNAPGPWRFRHAGGEQVIVAAAGPLAANSGEALVPALLAGLGVARLPGFIIGPDLNSGALVELLADWPAPAVGLHLLTPPGRRPARVEALLAFLAEHLRDPCELNNPRDSPEKLA